MDWVIICVVSIILGVLCQREISHRFGVLIPFPIIALLVSLNIGYKMYFFEYSGGGAPLWPIALIYQSGVGIFISIFSYFVSQSLFRTSDKNP